MAQVRAFHIYQYITYIACIHGHCNIIIINNIHVLSIGISIPRKIFVSCVVCFSTNGRGL